MLQFLRDFFINKQTFASAVGDLVGAAAVLAATPEGLQALAQINPYVPMAVVLLGYIGGAVSGRKTAR